jgi:hypothetical protein
MSVTAFEDRPETARGRVLYEMLLAIHARLRRDLARVAQLAAAVTDGLPSDELREELEDLRSNSLLWQFQMSCLRYCSFVHMHHDAEDVEFFDELEQTNPTIGSVVERLRAEHRAVSTYVDAVEAAVRALTGDQSHEARRAVADALDVLEQHLLAHLDFEEQNVAATARRLRDLPFSSHPPEVADSDLPTEEDQQ